MKIAAPKRRRKAAKRFDPTDLREVLKDRRQWCAIGVVTKPIDGSQHWRIESENGTAVDILVEVVLQPSQERVEARLAAGMWLVPDLGDEVAVMLPAGRVDFMPTILAILSGNVVPTEGGQGPQPRRIVIAVPPGGEVYVHDGSGGAEPLVRRSEFNGHTHGPGTFTNSGGNVTGESGGADDVDGTAVLKAK